MTDEKPKRYAQKLKGFKVTDTDQALLASLSAEHREILAQTGTIEEIAARLGMSIGTVKSRTHRARTALAKLREQGAE